MTKKRSSPALCRLGVAIVFALPMAVSAQTIRGFSMSDQPAPAKRASGDKFRTVAKPIMGRYIVVLDRSVAKLASEGKSALPSVSSVAQDIVSAHGATLLHSYDHVLRGFAVQASDDALARLLADPRVNYVEEDGRPSVQAVQSDPTWGLDRIDQRQLPLDNVFNYDTTAGNVHAYVIDTGLNASHQDFAGRVGNGASFVNDQLGTGDCNGHGTHVAGTLGGSIWGVAKGVTLHPVRVFGCTDSGNANSRVIAGIDWVRANHIKPAVANLSLGGAANLSIDQAVNDLIGAGVTVVAAAGNSGGNACELSPARVPAALTVGSTNSEDLRALSSSFGSCLDLFAPGEAITSASHNSNTGNTLRSGTSMAAPHVAGAAAIHLAAHPNDTPAQVAAAISVNATPNKVAGAGTGSPNRLLYVPNTPPASIPLRPGLSGAWYNASTSGQGFMIDIDPLSNVVFAGWYTFDFNGQQSGGPSGQRWYSLLSNYAPGDTAKTLAVSRNTGGNFDAPPITQSEPVGTARLSFQSCNNARLDYNITVDGQNKNGTIPLTRLGTDIYCPTGINPTYSLGQDGINPSLNGAWYEPRTSGQGFHFLFLPANNNFAFLAWYTYDVNGQSSGASGQRWYSIVGNFAARDPNMPPNLEISNLTIRETVGGRFDARPPDPSDRQVGTATLRFHGCDSATLTYQFNDGRPGGTIPLSRLTGGGNCTP